MSDCIGPINIIPDNNQVVLVDVNKTITVIDNNCCTTVDVTQPVTSVIQVLTGPQGPPGDTSNISFIATGSVTASVNIGPNIFLINSGSLEFFSIDNQGSTTISSSASNIFLIQNSFSTPVLTVSQSGILILSTQSIELTDPAPNGGLYFTSNSFFIGLD
jgi:hypothetical protein